MGGGFGDLLERDSEREVVIGAIDRALGGMGGTLVIEGPAGIGKTGLVAAAAIEAAERGARVLLAAGSDLEHDLRFGVVRGLLTAAAVESGVSVLKGPAALAGPVLGLGPPAPGGDPVTAALHGLHWLCGNLAERQPLVLAVDDVHWADKASVRFLAYLARRLDGVPLLLLLSTRPAEPGVRRELLDGLQSLPAVHTIRPTTLSPEATAELIRRRLGADASLHLRDACQAATGGNPFLLGELLTALAYEHVDPTTAGSRVLQEIAPPTIARSVLVRLARLPEPAIRLAQAAAIFPQGAEFRHVAELSDCTSSEAAGAADRLVEVAIFAPGRPIRFLHPVMRTAVYSDLARTARAQMHAQAAKLLRTEGAPPDAIASHLLASEPGSDPDAFGDLLAAAGMSLASGAPDAAERYLDRALTEPVPVEATAPALHLRGIARMLAGDPGSVDDLRSAATVAATPDERASALRDLARALTFGLWSQEALQAIDDAVAVAVDADQDLFARCRIDRTWMAITSDRVPAGLVEELDQLDVPDEPSGLLELAMSVLKGQWLVWRCEDPERAVALVRRGLREGTLVAAGFDAMPIVAFAATALTHTDRGDEGLAAMESMMDAQRASGAILGVAYGHVVTAILNVCNGDLIEAESDLHLARELADGQLGGAEGDAQLQAYLALVALERSGPDAAAEILEGLETPAAWNGLLLHAVRGRAALAAGDATSALTHLEAAAAAADARGIRHPHYFFPWRGELALAAAATGQQERAVAQAEADLALARSFGVASTIGYALHVSALVRGGPEAVTLLEEACSTLASSPARLLHARALSDLGGALRRSNQRAAAREPLRQAIDLGHRLGAGWLVETATEELRATGGRLRRAYVTGEEALTPSERRIARLAADGLANREIAQRLYLTISTVEMHLGKAYRKLDISSRNELSAALSPDDPRA